MNRTLTDFQVRVYAAVRRIPCGCVTTYKLLAEEVGCRSCRAVGQALRHNPFAPDVPCHRVIASDGSVGGFQGRRDRRSLTRKRALLRQEGVAFHQGKLTQSERLYRFR